MIDLSKVPPTSVNINSAEVQNIASKVRSFFAEVGIDPLTEDDEIRLVNLYSSASDTTRSLFWDPTVAPRMSRATKSKSISNLGLHDLLTLYLENTSAHQNFRFARSVEAARIARLLEEGIASSRAKLTMALAMIVRSALETVGGFASLLRSSEMKIAEMNRSIHDNRKNLSRMYTELGPELIKMNSIIHTFDSKVRTDLTLYSKTGEVKRMVAGEDYFDPTKFETSYFEDVGKLRNLQVMPHNAEDWSVVYSFLCEFTHPSGAARLLNDPIKASKMMAGLRILEKAFNLDKRDENVETNLTNDLLKYLRAAILMAIELDSRSRAMDQSIHKVCRTYIRTILALDSHLFKAVRGEWPLYETCICLGEKKFRFCCCNKKNWSEDIKVP